MCRVDYRFDTFASIDPHMTQLRVARCHQLAAVTGITVAGRCHQLATVTGISVAGRCHQLAAVTGITVAGRCHQLTALLGITVSSSTLAAVLLLP